MTHTKEILTEVVTKGIYRKKREDFETSRKLRTEVRDMRIVHTQLLALNFNAELIIDKTPKGVIQGMELRLINSNMV